MQKDDIYRLPNQEIEKSIIYEIPRLHQPSLTRVPESNLASFNQKKYKLRE